MRGARAVAIAIALGACKSDLSLPTYATPPPDLDDPPADDAWVPPAESCDPAPLDSPTTFAPCTTGGGIFGTWVVDDLGLPAYDYHLDENAAARASFFDSEGLDRRDHWAAFGNRRVNALAFNDGYVEVLTQDRGPAWLNVFDATKKSFAGGFSFVDDGAATWATAFAWRPRGARTRRRFGMGYAEAETSWRKIDVARTIASPPGDAAVVIDDVAITNRSEIERTIRHYEYWDVARRPLTTNWLVSGMPLAMAPEMAREKRDAENDAFVETVSWAAADRALVVRRTLADGVSAPPPDEPSAVDFYPGDPFVAALVGEVDDVYVDQASFFGDGDPSAPFAVASRAPGTGTNDGVRASGSASGQPLALVLRSDVALAPGETRHLRFAFGYARSGEPVALDPAWKEPSRDVRRDQADALRDELPTFASDRDPFLHRELAWHASQLEASVGYRDYWKSHVVPQGSAYLYLHGADGASRDVSLFAVPLVYTDPPLAKEQLRLNMGLQRAADRTFSYAFQGHGMLDDALGLHAHPSDLDLFFLFAFAEYAGATGDDAFFDEKVPYWPREAVPDATAYDHVHDAVRHLFDEVGTGEHGLVRVLDGDWNDGIVFEATDRTLAMQKGESVPNTQMAVAVLPAIADLVEPRDPDLANEIRERVGKLHMALASAWTGSFYGRAYFGDGVLAHADDPTLEAQVWALVGGELASDSDRAKLVQTIATELDDPSPTGAMLSRGGQVWPAISGLLTWGYAQSDPERAWTHLARNTMAAHAIAFPSIWYGIWSGPDGLNSTFGDRPGEAWLSQVTPMTDFPVQNANQHAMPILAALRVAGIEATSRGLRIAPRVPGRTFSLRTKLVDLDQRGATIAGVYRPTGAGARTLRIEAPAGATIAAASLDGAQISVPSGASFVELPIPAANARSVRFVVTTST